MDFRAIAETITHHEGASAAFGVGLAAFGRLTYDFLKRDGWAIVRPARPVVHSAATRAAIERADASMKKLDLGS